MGEGQVTADGMLAGESLEESQPALQRAESSGTFLFEHAFARDNAGKLEDFYELAGDRLGEGSFGSAHRARCKKTGLERAVKSIDIMSVKNPVRFEREISIAKQLDHPNVVRLFETFRDARKIYLVMELCTGGELFDRIVEEAPSGFDERKAAGYIRQILAALCYLHAHRFAHRDVKPENFLFYSPSPDSALKVIDFGLACQFEEGKPMTTKAGTAYYVAPEVLKGEYNERCDLWSAGVISFILLCGYPPFSGDTDPEILRKVKEGFFEFRSPEWDGISGGAKNLVTQMLTVDPALRPAAEALLLSPWLRYKGTPQRVPIGTDFVTRLRSFHAHGRLKKVALAAVAQQLPDEDIENLQSIFRALDTNGDGMLSPEEIKQGMLEQGMKVPKMFEDIVQSIDCSGSGQLDYTEFVAATIDQKLYNQRDVCWAAFRIFDLDGDGKITKEELSQVLLGDNVQKALGVSRIERMIREVDSNGDGCIDFDEFCAMMKPTPKQKRQSAGGGAAAGAGASPQQAKRPRSSKSGA